MPPADVPPVPVTLTETVPAEFAGDVAVIWVSLSTTKVALAVPNVTPVAPVKPEPVTTTVVPPATGPLPGLTELTDGVAAKAESSPQRSVSKAANSRKNTRGSDQPLVIADGKLPA
jgi:hypothetical protein